MKSMLTGLAALIGALVVSAPLTLAAQSAPAPATPAMPAGYEILAVELRAVMLPSLASLVVKY